MAKILIMMTGGTIAQKVGNDGRMRIAQSVADLTRDLKTLHEVETFSFDARTGANLTRGLAKRIQEKVLAERSRFDGFVLITGTDSMEELAYLLDLVLKIDEPVVLTGSMKPSDIIGYDGLANLEQAVQVAGHDDSRKRGLLLAMNDDIHVARFVRKSDSQLIGAFVSHPGPVGQIRRGEVCYYYQNSRNPDYYGNVDLENLELRVPLLIFGFDQPFPKSMMEDVKGLVIAGMGTSSISEEWINYLTANWTDRIHIVLVSRCMIGTNYDDSYYRGSRTKYEEKGFRLTEYMELNPMQARLKLCLELTD